MSPLIDCVFLLLIFFLVTTMIRRQEKLIPIRLPDMTAAVAEAAHDNALVIGLDREGRMFAGQRAGLSSAVFSPIPDFDAWLAEHPADDISPSVSQPVRIEAHRVLPFQNVVDVIDRLKEHGFRDVGIRTREDIPTTPEVSP